MNAKPFGDGPQHPSDIPSSVAASTKNFLFNKKGTPQNRMPFLFKWRG